ncbi:hypothetical protein KFK09_013348 [Dendrobium nobile]|uniref:Uncharacterized protein n=1 Tax=Dendrobium nobile TaxID=94219 RepID=A0A8T3B9W8_DENNO|nr:hypothetical protein KFK09_013348 [Dendrobium nobile]
MPGPPNKCRTTNSILHRIQIQLGFQSDYLPKQDNGIFISFLIENYLRKSLISKQEGESSHPGRSKTEETNKDFASKSKINSLYWIFYFLPSRLLFSSNPAFPFLSFPASFAAK